MAIEKIKVRVLTPTERLLPGRGFYQVDDDTLFVQIGPFKRSRQFFSYLESESVRLDIDREGRPIFIEIGLPRRHWQVLPDFEIPPAAETADIRFTDFRKTISVPTLLAPPDRRSLLIRFDRPGRSRCYRLADSVIAQVSDDGGLMAVWVMDIVDDFAGQQLAAFRKSQATVQAV
jgi:hypothetical protein